MPPGWLAYRYNWTQRCVLTHHLLCLALLTDTAAVWSARREWLLPAGPAAVLQPAAAAPAAPGTVSVTGPAEIPGPAGKPCPGAWNVLCVASRACLTSFQDYAGANKMKYMESLDILPKSLGGYAHGCTLLGFSSISFFERGWYSYPRNY